MKKTRKMSRSWPSDKEGRVSQMCATGRTLSLTLSTMEGLGVVDSCSNVHLRRITEASLGGGGTVAKIWPPVPN